MVGPSSSHTAGAVKIGRVSRKLLAEEVADAKIYFHGSFLATGKGHGTDKAILAGLLGMQVDDPRIPESFTMAKESGMSFTLEGIDLGDVHPNSVKMNLTGKSGRTLEVIAASVGGGQIRICELDGLTANFSGDYPTLIVHNIDQPGHVAEVTSMLAHKSVNIATMQLYRESRGTRAVMVIECDREVPQESIEWLEDFLMNNAKAVMVISHDKAFVDHITTRTIEIARGRIYDYKVNYSHYLELRRERREQQQAAYDNQQKMIAETREFIERFKGTYSKTNQVQSRVRMLEKLELIEVDEEDRSALNLRFPPAPRSGSYPVITSELGKAYGDHRVFSDVSITIGRGDKVAFVGRNGEGKSTMVKAIMGQIDFEGEIRIGHNVRIGYFAQNEASGLDESITVFKTVDDIAVGDIRTRLRDILGAFLFRGEDIDKKVKVLSGGERARLAMIKLLLEPVNLLILDEPTNHLDLKTKEILKEALMAFDGTLIVVSHDRDFLDGLTSKIYEFSHGRVTEHLDGVYGFLRKKKIENISEIERRKA